MPFPAFELSTDEYKSTLIAVLEVLYKDRTLETTLARANLRDAGVKMLRIMDWWTSHSETEALRRAEESARAHEKEEAERAELERLKEKLG